MPCLFKEESLIQLKEAVAIHQQGKDAFIAAHRLQDAGVQVLHIVPDGVAAAQIGGVALAHDALKVRALQAYHRHVKCIVARYQRGVEAICAGALPQPDVEVVHQADSLAEAGQIRVAPDGQHGLVGKAPGVGIHHPYARAAQRGGQAVLPQGAQQYLIDAVRREGAAGLTLAPPVVAQQMLPQLGIEHIL